VTWTHILIHHSADKDDPWVDAVDYDRWHRNKGWRRIGYHYVVELVERNYHAIQARPLIMIGSHSPGWNSTAIGVCFAGNFMDHEPPFEQLVVGAELVSGLCVHLRILIDNILPHSETRDTDCPGRFFPFNNFVGMVTSFAENAEVTA
jgi:hypothetical protein